MKIHIVLVKYSTILLVSQTTALASGAQEKASNGLLLQALLHDGLQGCHGAGGWLINWQFTTIDNTLAHTIIFWVLIINGLIWLLNY